MQLFSYLFLLYIKWILLFQVLVEYDDLNWQRREWIQVYKEGLFHMFLVEQGLFWAERIDPYTSAKAKILWPALVSIQNNVPNTMGIISKTAWYYGQPYTSNFYNILYSLQKI